MGWATVTAMERKGQGELTDIPNVLQKTFAVNSNRNADIYLQTTSWQVSGRCLIEKTPKIKRPTG
jgi:hypothetical protein